MFSESCSGEHRVTTEVFGETKPPRVRVRSDVLRHALLGVWASTCPMQMIYAWETSQRGTRLREVTVFHLTRRSGGHWRSPSYRKTKTKMAPVRRRSSSGHLSSFG